MSIAKIERFAADLKSTAMLRVAAERARAQEAYTTPVEEPVAAGAEVPDAELDGVAGGQ